jgi:hypothetical protein
MIQRIQTLWLLLSAILSGFLMNGAIVNFIDKAGIRYFTGFSGIYKITDSGKELLIPSVPMAALIILVPILSVFCTLIFKNRKIQKIVTLVLFAFSFCLTILVIYYSILTMNKYNAELVPGIKMAIPLIIMISVSLAYRGISKDDRLVKSYDRLR